MEKLRDIDIRGPLIQKIIHQNQGHSFRIVPEMGICDGLSRVDIAVANGRLCGYEIKSDADTLDRLPAQQEYYNKTFDKVYIIVGEKYGPVIDNFVPDWWGIYVASSKIRGGIVLKEKRRGRRNYNIDADSLLELLWRNELETLLRLNGVKSLSGKNRRILRKLAVDQIPLSTIRDYTRETIKHREEWR